MKTKKVLLIIAAVLLLLPCVTAVCTVTFDKETYFVGESAAAVMICSDTTEKSKNYALAWSNITGGVYETDVGVTPESINTYFYDAFTIPSGWPEGVLLYANLSGTNLEGSDEANVSAASSSSLRIVNATFTCPTAGHHS